jgi:hypothetical protein
VFVPMSAVLVKQHFALQLNSSFAHVQDAIALMLWSLNELIFIACRILHHECDNIGRVPYEVVVDVLH